MKFKALVLAVAGMGMVGLAAATEVVVMQGGTELARGTLQALSQPSATGPLTVTISGSSGGTPVDSARTLSWTAGTGGTVAAACSGDTCTTISGSSYSATCGGATACPTIQLTATANTDYSFSSWSGACAEQGASCSVTLSNGTATANFTQQVSGGGGTCGATPDNVVIEEAGTLGTTWPQKMFQPVPNKIVAFKLTVPTAGATGTFTATKTSAAPVTKLVSVSSCPGDYNNPVGAQARCVVFSTESSLVRLTTNQAAPSYYCKLQPGQTYYVNAVSKESLASTSLTCSTSTNCSFFAAHN